MKKYAIIGDLHGNFTEFEQVLRQLGFLRDSENYTWTNNNDYQLIQVGDIVDYRGDNPEDHSALNCVQLIRELQRDCGLIALNSNHNNKFYRWLNGNKVKIGQGLENTKGDYDVYFDTVELCFGKEKMEEEKLELKNWVMNLPDYHKFTVDGHTYVCVHAYFHPRWLMGFAKREGEEPTAKQLNGIRERMLYGIRNADDERWLWWEDEEFTSLIPEDVTIIAGHYHEVNIKHPRAKMIDATPHVIAYLPLEDRIIKSGAGIWDFLH